MGAGRSPDRASQNSRVPRRGRLFKVRRFILRRRRLGAAILVAVAVVAGLRSLAPAPVTAPPVAPGDGAASAVRAEVASVGRRLSQDLQEGVGVARGVGRGWVAIPLRLPDAAMAGLLEPGDQITLVATTVDPAGGDQTARIATGVRVLDLPEEEGADGVMASGQGRLLIVGVAPGDIDALSGAAARSVLTFSWDH